MTDQFGSKSGTSSVPYGRAKKYVETMSFATAEKA